MVSIIIPVFNVEKYIDRCLESVVNQTYKDIEILIMEAKSTDKSLEKVLAWAKDDDRFIIVSRRDGGLGPARNYALGLAGGEFVVFLDSDDWLDLDFVEKTVRQARETSDTDLVMTSFCRHAGDDAQICRNPWEDGTYESPFSKKCMMAFGNNSMWSKLIRKELFDKHRLLQPALPYEDLAVYPALIAASRKIAVCNDIYMHYQAERPGSLYRSSTSCYQYPQVIEWAEKEFAKVCGCQKYRSAFRYCLYRHFFSIFYQALGKEEAEKRIAEETQKNYFTERFGCLKDMNPESYIVYGGFASRWTAHRLPEGKTRLKEHFVFTNLIAQMSGGSSSFQVKHDNPFRENAVKNDIEKTFGRAVSGNGKEQIFYILDFLNECQDVIRDGENSYITWSEALKETGFSVPDSCSVISWQSDKFWNLWKGGCDRLTEKLKHIPGRVVLLKYFYAESYFDGKQNSFYDTAQRIIQKNMLLKKMYGYFEKNMPEVKSYELPDGLRFTDVSGQGLPKQPEYLNSKAYNFMSQSIELDIAEERYAGFNR